MRRVLQWGAVLLVATGAGASYRLLAGRAARTAGRFPEPVGERQALPEKPALDQERAGAPVGDDPRARQLASERLFGPRTPEASARDRKSTRLNSSHVEISYA